MNKPSTQNLFFADLHHPGGTDAEIEELFEQIPANTRRVFFLGDTFHYWINEESFIEEAYAPFLHQLRKWAADGIQLFFLEGNRDFLASHYLDDKPWIDVLTNPSIIDLAGRAVYIGHGDELAWNDWSYQMYKSVIRSRPLRFLADALPGSMRKKIANRMSRASRSIVASKDRSMLAIPEKAYRQVIDSGVDMIIHGHLHASYQQEIHGAKHAGTVICFGWKDGKRNLIHFEG